MLIAIVSCTATNPYRVLRSISDGHPPLTGYKLCPIVHTVICFNCDGQGNCGDDGVGIDHICHFFYTGRTFNPKFLHPFKDNMKIIVRMMMISCVLEVWVKFK